MELIKSKVIFDQEAHTYTLDGLPLQGITGIISKHLFPDKYSNVPDYILNRAADKGSLIHGICELIDELGVSHDSEEAKGYLKLKDLYGLCHEASEYLVSDNKFFASCIDKVYREGKSEFSLGDIKTTYKLDKEYVRWQLSIYAYLFEKQNPGCKVVRLFAIWLKGKIAELVEVERIPDEVIIRLLNAEVNREQFTNPYAVAAPSNEMPAKYREMELSIIKISEQEKYWKKQKKRLMDGVMKEMVKAGVYSWKGDKISFTRKKDYIRQKFDEESFKKDHKDLYEQYLKETPYSGSITLKIS